MACISTTNNFNIWQEKWQQFYHLFWLSFVIYSDSKSALQVLSNGSREYYPASPSKPMLPFPSGGLISTNTLPSMPLNVALNIYPIPNNGAPHIYENELPPLCFVAPLSREVVLTRLRLGHTYFTHVFLLKGVDPFFCISCQC